MAALSWKKLTIKNKIATFSFLVFLIVVISGGIVFWALRYAMFDFKTILDANSVTKSLMTSLSEESTAFEQYMMNSKNENHQYLLGKIQNTRQVLEKLPTDYNLIGEECYAKTYALLRAYRVYSDARDRLLAIEGDKNEHIQEIYEVYDMQDYLRKYAEELMNLTIERGDNSYETKLPTIRIIPTLVIVLGLVLALAMLILITTMRKTVFEPVLQLADSAKKIADNDFFIDDIAVENDDEIGELVHAFNKMKYATGEYITALESKRETLDLLHKEELEKLEMEKKLETIRLELLKSQIKPHFLFNTLNVIAGMANLEEAETTEKMTQALSNLFRYNLKTPEVYVALNKELQVMEDYMYLQQMRFGSRVAYEINCEVNQERILVPSFTFQPLVENAIVHGIGKKESGGKIEVRVWETDARLHIVIADNGVGMDEEELAGLTATLHENESERTGIGIRNVYHRIMTLYQDGSFVISSEKGEGTVITIEIPVMENPI